MILFYMYTCRERIREGLPPQFRSSPLLINLSDFLSGAVLGAFISTVFFPVNVTKTHMQLVVGGEFMLPEPLQSAPPSRQWNSSTLSGPKAHTALQLVPPSNPPIDGHFEGKGNCRQ